MKKQIYLVKFTHTKYENYLSAAPLRFESLNLDLPLTEQTKRNSTCMNWKSCTFISTCDSVAGPCTINSVLMLFLASYPHEVQCPCFNVAKLITVSSVKFRNHFTPTCARLFASCLKATTRISVVLEQLARKIVIDAIHILVACLTLHPKAWKKILLMINLDNYNNYVIYNRQ